MKRHAPAALRNREPIFEVIGSVLPSAGTVVEVASGSGEHVTFFAEKMPQLSWQPTDIDPDALASIDAHVADTGLSNVNAALRLDTREEPWPISEAAAMICFNMVHISPWASTVGLIAGAGRVLPVGAPLITYGPYKFDGELPAPSNQAFDQSLRTRNSDWGIRDIVDMTRLAEAAGFTREAVHAMPANNHTVIFRRV